MYVWDIDGTLLHNRYAQPDWNDPAAIHPQTGEPITGPMPIYSLGTYLNPVLEGVGPTIETVLTARPEYRRAPTLAQIETFTGCIPETLIMYPSHRLYTHTAALAYKLNHLDYLVRNTRNHEDIFYIDEDPKIRLAINTQNIHSEPNDSFLFAISLDEYISGWGVC